VKLVSLTCTHCGAKLPQQKESGTYTCSYCGTSFAGPTPRERPEKPKPAPKSAKEKPPAKSTEPRSGLRLGALFSLFGSIVPLAIIGFVVYRLNGPMLKGQVNGLRLGSPLRALWDRASGPPVPVQLGGREAVLGRMRLNDDQLFIVATDSATGNLLWKVGPLGTYGEAYQNAHFATTAQHIVASDARGNLHVHELATGKEVKKIPLRDRASNLCAVPPNGIAVAVIDHHHVLLDTTTMTLSEAPLPSGCPGHRRGFREDRAPHTRAPSLRGFEMRDAHVEGTLGVAAAVKSPGTPTPYAIGFTPGSREVRWQELLPTVDPLSVRTSERDVLAGGRYFAIYGVGSDGAGWRLTALDARTGSRLYDVELRPVFAVDSIEALVATPGFVYVNRTSSLEIFEAATGKLISTVGNETYR
jgi:hypothetical protein